jgi:hypothetical protein
MSLKGQNELSKLDAGTKYKDPSIVKVAENGENNSCCLGVLKNKELGI